MSIYQRIVRNVLYPLDRWRTRDSAELRYLHEFERTQFLPREEIRERALERLKRVLEHAHRRCPFYRRRSDSVGFIPGDLNSLSDLSALPILEKRDIQHHRDDMVATNWSRDDLIQDQTGGSTGAAISFFLSHDRKCSRAAATWRHNRWAGWDIGDRVAMVWGSTPDIPENTLKWRLRNLLIDRNLCLDTGHVTESKMRSFHHALKRFRPKIIQAYAKSLALLAEYLDSHNLEPYQPQAIVSSAEVLEPADRERIERVFGCPIFNRYGCREFSVIASECPEHNGLHTMGEGLYIEVVRGDRPARSGESGAILVTDLLNLAMPMIRYRIGDVGVLDESTCPCGRGLSRLQSVEGRITDFLVGNDNRLVSGVFLATYVVAKLPGLGQVQLHQDAPGHVLYKIAMGAASSVPPKSDLGFLETETKRYLGDDTKVEYEFVRELPAEPSGKHRFCISKVKHALTS
ncbi:MAG: phenylacetate--CoA ligase family protein [Planctomycetes bacterium]|nr:phenylacetate--CoA ligase family protein [Planctomycetota bacterium]MBL7037651.1 phenylacetate--CoA ligase family protein [Pirellulaceae bacterium]